MLNPIIFSMPSTGTDRRLKIRHGENRPKRIQSVRERGC